MNHELREYDIEVMYTIRACPDSEEWTYREANPAEVMHEYGIKTITEYPSDRLLSLPKYAAIILAVAHNEFMSIDLKEHKKAGTVIYDVKGIVNLAVVDGRL